MTLKPHQEEALLKMHNGCILAGGTGVGKSYTAAAYYMKREAPKAVYVITTAKKRDSLDWAEEFARYGVGRTASVAGLLTVDSWNNINKYAEVKDAFFIFDEQRLVGSGAWTKAFIKIARHNRWILLSATPGDTWLDYIPVFVANGFYRNRTEFKREHVIYNTYSKFPKVERYTGVGKLVRLRNSLLVQMPYIRHTRQISKIVSVDYDRDLFDRVVNDRWHVYENRPLRDVAELFIVMRKVVNSDSTRLTAIQRLLKVHPKLIVFYNFDYELEALRSLSSRIEMQIESKPAKIRSMSSRTQKSESESNDSENLESLRTPSSGSRTSSGPTSSQLSKRRLTSETSKSTSESGTPPSDESGASLKQMTASSLMQSSIQSSKEKDPSTSLPTETSEMKTSRPTSTGIKKKDTTFAIAERNGHKHQAIPNTDSWLYLVQYQAGAEGWNCISTDAMVFYSMTYSYKNFHQAHGRIDRLNTPYTNLYYYVLKSKSLIDVAIAKSLKAKKNFNESDFARSE